MIIGCLNLIFGLFFLAASVGIAPDFIRSEAALVGAFVVFLLTIFPFVATFTKLGLNQEDEVSGESDERKKELSVHVPHWEVPFYVGLVVIVLSMFFHSFIHPIYIFMATGSLLSSYWFMVVYPVAKQKLPPL